MKKISFILGAGILIFLIGIIKMKERGVTKIDFFILLIALALIGLSIFIFREKKLKKRRYEGQRR